MEGSELIITHPSRTMGVTGSSLRDSVGIFLNENHREAVLLILMYANGLRDEN